MHEELFHGVSRCPLCLSSFEWSCAFDTWEHAQEFGQFAHQTQCPDSAPRSQEVEDMLMQKLRLNTKPRWPGDYHI